MLFSAIYSIHISLRCFVCQNSNEQNNFPAMESILIARTLFILVSILYTLHSLPAMPSTYTYLHFPILKRSYGISCKWIYAKLYIHFIHKEYWLIQYTTWYTSGTTIKQMLSSSVSSNQAAKPTIDQHTTQLELTK